MRTARHRFGARRVGEVCGAGNSGDQSPKAAEVVDRGHGFDVQFLHAALVLVVANNNAENMGRDVERRERGEVKVLRWPLDCVEVHVGPQSASGIARARGGKTR